MRAAPNSLAKKVAAALNSTSMNGAPMMAANLSVASRFASSPSKLPLKEHQGELVMMSHGMHVHSKGVTPCMETAHGCMGHWGRMVRTIPISACR